EGQESHGDSSLRACGRPLSPGRQALHDISPNGARKEGAQQQLSRKPFAPVPRQKRYRACRSAIAKEDQDPRSDGGQPVKRLQRLRKRNQKDDQVEKPDLHRKGGDAVLSYSEVSQLNHG